MKPIDPNHVEMIQRMAEDYRPANDGAWLQSLTASTAFLVCIAMGPWNEKRRFGVADSAIQWMIKQNASDIGDIDLKKPPEVYPLRWQNDHLQSMCTSLWERDASFYDVYDRWLDILIKGEWPAWPPVLKELFSMCGVPKRGTKVLWLFARDFLQIPAFPIDRRVKRVLAEHGLPADPWYMTYACEQADINTNALARACFERKM